MDEPPARAARIDAPLLNARLSKAQDADELLGLFARHGWQMDGMHYGNLWNTKLTSSPRGLRWVRTGYAYQPPALGTYRRRRAA